GQREMDQRPIVRLRARDGVRGRQEDVLRIHRDDSGWHLYGLQELLLRSRAVDHPPSLHADGAREVRQIGMRRIDLPSALAFMVIAPSTMACAHQAVEMHDGGADAATEVAF